MPGQPNDHLWEDCIDRIQKAVFPNGRLFDMGSFPMLLNGGETGVEGVLMYPDPKLSQEGYQLLVQRLDTLENYQPEDMNNSPYYRALQGVVVEDAQPVTAWVYLGRPHYTIGRPLIPDGSWVNYSANVQSRIASWWEARGQGLLFGKTTIKRDGKD